MQEQNYERFASEPERVSAKQGVRNPWDEGEKLQPESPRQNSRRGRSRRATIIIVIVVLLILLFVVLLLGFPVFFHVSNGTFPGGGPGPIQHP